LKLQINNFLWMYAPGHVCLRHAETLACSILMLLQDVAGRHSQEEWEPLDNPPHTRFQVRNARTADMATKRGICYAFRTHFDIHWDDGTHALDVNELSERGVHKDDSE